MPEPHLPDLHIHTHFSDDGDDSPQDLISMAANMGVDMIAFTDHDSVAGTPLTSTQGVRILPGVEISSAFCGSEVHLLAYSIDPENSTLKEILETNDRYRWRQFRQCLDSLVSLGFRTDTDLAMATAAGRPPKTGGILTMLHQLNTTHERLRSYGTPDQPDWNTFYRDFFSPRDIATSSLEAIQPEETEAFCRLARDLNLNVTAGSDYHGPTCKPGIKLGDPRWTPGAVRRDLHETYLSRCLDCDAHNRY